jgi:dipeptidyl aminopeptidase/acylaminoacyl peptidase
MKKVQALFILAFFMLQISFAQDKSLYTKEQFIKEGDTLNYRMLLPDNFDPAKEYPVLFFLHQLKY